MDFLLGLLFFISLSVFGGSVVLLIVSIFSTSMRKDRRLYLILLVISLIVSIVSLVIAASNSDTEDMDNTTNVTEVTNPQLSDDTANEITSVETDISDDTNNTDTPQLEENNVDENKSFPSNAESVCRALTKRFIENVVMEDYSMLAFNVEDFELDANDNGTIKILYLPSNAGNGSTKVNLTVSKNGNIYTIESALLSGLYELDMNMVPEEYKVFIEN